MHPEPLHARLRRRRPHVRTGWHTAFVGTALFAAVLSLGCDPVVRTFTVTPRHICAGERVEVQWDVTGSPTLTLTPPMIGVPVGSVPSQGRMTLAPVVTTSVDLRVTRFLGTPTTPTQEIEVRQTSDKPEPVTASLGDNTATPGCGDGKVWATVHAKRFAGDLKAVRVSSHPEDVHTYEIDHAGVHATLVPGATLPDFAATPIEGDWLLRSLLLPGEICGTTTLPRNLVVDVYTQCVGTGTP